MDGLATEYMSTTRTDHSRFFGHSHNNTIYPANKHFYKPNLSYILHFHRFLKKPTMDRMAQMFAALGKLTDESYQIGEHAPGNYTNKSQRK